MSRTYGLIVDYITGSYQVPLFDAIKKLAASADINLLIYEGRAYNSPRTIEREHNIVYKLLNDDHVDGYILFSSSVFHCYPADRGCIQMLHNTRKPVISLNVELPGIPSVMIDNQSGMHEAVEHLIQEHGYSNIAFITGPSGNTEANKRLAAYMSTLKENDIRINSDWIIPGDFHPEDGVAAIQTIMKIPEIEAVVFANDDMALGAQEFLSQHAPEYLDKIAMTGFDNLPNSSMVAKPLTSVAQPFNDIALQAFQLLEEQIRSDTIPEKVLCKTYLDIKQSCGCNIPPQVSSKPVQIIQYTSTIHEYIQSYDETEVFDQLSSALDQLEIKTCYVVKFDELYTFDQSKPQPDNASLAFGFEMGKRLELETAIPFNTKELLPENLLNRLDNHALIIKPLFFAGKHLGFALFDASGDNYINIEPLRGHLSTCLMGSNL